VFWWDPLAALAATDARLVDYRFMRIAVVQEGVSSGRTIESPRGTGMRVGVSANQELFETEMIDVLNGDGQP
jgi:inosine-uridine nucleoside N-ribohydrolase